LAGAGFNINAIQRHSGCRVGISTRQAREDAYKERTATFSGTQVQVALAMAMVEELLASSVDQNFMEAFYEKWRLKGNTTAATVEQHCEAEAREQSIGSAAATQVVTVHKQHTPDEVRKMISKKGESVIALRHYFNCEIDHAPKGPNGSTALVNVTFTGTQMQVELAVDMTRELLEAKLADPFSQSITRDVIERWRQAAEARATGSRATRPEAISKGYTALSVNHGVGAAGHGSASFVPAMEAAPRVAVMAMGPHRSTRPPRSSVLHRRVSAWKFCRFSFAASLAKGDL